MFRRPRLVVVHKKSAYQLHLVQRRDAHLRRLLRLAHPKVRDLYHAHEVHERTLRTVVETLRREGLSYRLVYRGDLRRLGRADLVICVGGDGTFLQTAHLVQDQPVLGVNSDPPRSEAVFCAATGATFARILRQALGGELSELRLFRLSVRLNGRRIAPHALNDVLIAHNDPATMSRYYLKVGGRAEAQKSSGLWVATPAGSSSAILAAGGQRLPWADRRFQYWPRELYRGRLTHGRVTGGLVPMGRTVEVTWLMREGAFFIDGPHVRHPLRFGDRLSIGLSASHPLRLLGVKGR